MGVANNKLCKGHERQGNQSLDRSCIVFEKIEIGYAVLMRSLCWCFSTNWRCRCQLEQCEWLQVESWWL